MVKCRERGLEKCTQNQGQCFPGPLGSRAGVGKVEGRPSLFVIYVYTRLESELFTYYLFIYHEHKFFKEQKKNFNFFLSHS